MTRQFLLALAAGAACLGQLQAAEPAAALPAAQAPASAKGLELLAGKRTMILGDSITQNGTYVSYLEYFLQKRHPAQAFDIINVGLASETASGLSENGHAGGAFPRPCVHERLQRALGAVKPQVVVACYGMNDGIYKPYSDEIMKAFQDGVTKLAAACQAAGAELVLVTPPVFEGGDYDQVLAKFAAWEVAQPPKGVVAVVDLHTAMAAARDERQKADPKFRFTGDNIHPGELGHIVMAQAILQGLGVPCPAGTAEELQKSAHADPLFKLVSQRRNARSEGWMKYIGYTREKHVPAKTGNIEKTEADAKDLQSKIDALKK